MHVHVGGMSRIHTILSVLVCFWFANKCTIWLRLFGLRSASPAINHKFVLWLTFAPLQNGSLSYLQAVTVQEGDSNLITRIRRSNGDQVEIRHEFAKEGMKYVRTLALCLPPPSNDRDFRRPVITSICLPPKVKFSPRCELGPQG
jgi:hypothetical protein